MDDEKAAAERLRGHQSNAGERPSANKHVMLCQRELAENLKRTFPLNDRRDNDFPLSSLETAQASVFNLGIR